MNNLKNLISFCMLILVVSSPIFAAENFTQTMKNAGAQYSQQYNSYMQQQVATQQTALANISRDNVAQMPVATPRKSTSYCDCYDETNPYNTRTNNFALDNFGNRVSRKTPACKCLPKNTNQIISSIPSSFNAINPIPNSGTGTGSQSTNAPATTIAPVDLGIKY